MNKNKIKELKEEFDNDFGHQIDNYCYQITGGVIAFKIWKFISQALQQRDKEWVEKIKNMKYKYNHKHDIQVGFRGDDKYSCGNCKQTLKEIYGTGWCPHFKSYNNALDNLLQEMEEK